MKCRIRFGAFLIAALVGAAACGDDSGGGSSADDVGDAGADGLADDTGEDDTDTTDDTDNMDDAPIGSDRPQEPIRPFPYSEVEVRFDNPRAGIALAGTLTHPTGAGPFPAVILVHGSGRLDRDVVVARHKDLPRACR